MKQKGLELPIQIFITLFILLAVAILVLQLVTNQIESQSAKLTAESAKSEATAIKGQQQNACRKLCNCDSLKAKAQFCVRLIKGGLDVDGDGFATKYDKTLLVGEGVCEDRILCSQLISCECGPQKLNHVVCKDVLCSFWQEEGLSDAQRNSRLAEFYKPGACFAQLSQQEKDDHWFTSLFPNGQIAC